MTNRPDCSLPRRHGHGFTMVEILVVAGLMIMITIVAIKLFFSQTKMVTQSIEYMYVNDSFRKITMFLGNDLREATHIFYPVPVMKEDVPTKTTKGLVLRIWKKEVDPSLSFTSHPDQVKSFHEVTYELVPYPNKLAKNTPRFKLIRKESIPKKRDTEDSQRQEIADNIRDFIIYRTFRRPMMPRSLRSKTDRLLQPVPSHLNGSGNDVVHLRVVLERPRTKDEGKVYDIAMTTSFYKRGKEVFKVK